MTPTFTGDAPDIPVEFKGIYAGYRRLKSNQKFKPPFRWSGKVKINEVMDPPVFAATGVTSWYQPKLNFCPLYTSNDRNIVSGPANPQNPVVVGISAEMRDVRPEQPYGTRSGYERMWRTDLQSNPIGDGLWHDFRWEVDSNSIYRLFWDGYLVLDVVEKMPCTIDPGPVYIGLRLDFLDVEFKDQKVVEAMPVPKIISGIPGQLCTVTPTRILDTRQGHRLEANTNTQLPITGLPPAGATAMLINAIAVDPDSAGYLTIYSGPKPDTSSINYGRGGAIANLLVVPMRTERALYAYSSANVDVVLDLVGYLA